MSNHDSTGPNRPRKANRRGENPCLPAALRYQKLGLSVTVLCPPDHSGMGRSHIDRCKSPGKAPWHRWKDCQTRPMTRDEIRDLFRQHPDSNVGIALGPVSGLIRVDVEGPAGEAELDRLSGGQQPKTWEFTSGKGRGLLYFIPEGVVLRTTVKPIAVHQELRLQGKGAQTVLPPSRHASGKRYRWKDGHAPGQIEPAPAPDWIIRAMRADAPTGVRRRGGVSRNGQPIHEGARNTTLTSQAGSMRRRGMSEEAIAAALLAENEGRCDPPLDETEVRGIAASVSKYPPAQADDGRPTIPVTTDEHVVNERAAAALGRAENLYQRGGFLVRVVCDDSPAAKGIRRPLAPRIDILPASLLRERLTACARFVRLKTTDAGVEHIPEHPPGWCVSAVHARANWTGVAHLEAVVDYPVLRPDGTILTEPGYDADTCLLLMPTQALPDVPDHPTRDDAAAARDELLDVVADFPFQHKVHIAAWLAGLLTPLCRFAFAGPAPLFLVDSNVRGAGKGLLLDCIAHIVTGARFTVATYTADEDELRKRITSLALGGDRLVLFDNLDGKFGNCVLDAALTGPAWKDRVLGVNRMAEAPLLMTWFATGNNVMVAADTARRTCHIRLESDRERPEERDDFRHRDLLRYVGRRRRRLLRAALTILRAYALAGMPDMGLPAWGSFEGWSRLVRSAVVWVGLPDPGKTRLLLQQNADVTAECMAQLLDCWGQMDPEGKGLTAAEVIHRVYRDKDAQELGWVNDAKDALEGLLGKPDARSLGNLLRSYRRRVFRDRYIDRVGKKHKVVRWAIFPADAFRRRGKNTPLTPKTPPEP